MTDLAKMHYVLFITMDGNPTEALRFKLNVLKMQTFGAALSFVEEKTVKMTSVTLHMGRKPTPSSSPPREAASSDEDFESSIAEAFASVDIQEVFDDAEMGAPV